ncbi:unnamed protein product [Penicillium olsonii]|nr:unnamed protein product [Penicillium olsonii]
MTIRRSSSHYGDAAKKRRLGSEGEDDVLDNPFLDQRTRQTTTTIPNFVLESGKVLRKVPIAYKSWGELSVDKSNVMVVCHALSGSADVGQWWGPLLGPGKAFDTDRFFVICMNSLGSPYGSASPITSKNGNSVEGRYGADFPITTIRDDARAHRLVLNELGVNQVAAVIGGSMGGMLALEWSFFGKLYVRSIVAIATSAHQSAWGIGWDEVQRHAIYSDTRYKSGHYQLNEAPVSGLEAARMAALLTYRSRESLEDRFGRDTMSKKDNITNRNGHPTKLTPDKASLCQPTADEAVGSRPTNCKYSVESYLRYQAQKFSHRFDSNCYISLTHKLDSHDISRNRTDTISEALALIQQPTLVVGIRSDGIYALQEQVRMARCIPNAMLREIVSCDGHDAFLIETHQLNWLIVGFLFDHLPDIMRK